MDFWRSLGGAVQAELTSADPAGALSAIHRAGISLLHAARTGDLTVTVTVGRADYRALAALARRRGEKLRLLKRLGFYWAGKRLLGRPVLLMGVAFLLAMVLYLPTRIFFIRVEGNATIPTRLILAQAEECGIRFGASRRAVRSEKMKNALLGAIPELQWAGVNTSGCVATISVKERAPAEETDRKYGVSSIVAIRDGVITEATVLKGNALCKTGQAVKAGEVLISGYTDCGISIQASRAQGEVFARTQRPLIASALTTCVEQGQARRTEKKFSLRIGKKLIKFYKGSGILDSTCDKMYAEHVLTLPGGFSLPIAWVEEQWTWYDNTVCQVPEEELGQTLRGFAKRYLLAQMVAGQILEQEELIRDGVLYADYACQEMIGREQSEEIIQSNGENH